MRIVCSRLILHSFLEPRSLSQDRLVQFQHFYLQVIYAKEHSNEGVRNCNAVNG